MYSFCVINLMPVDLDCVHLIKLFYSQERDIPILNAAEVSMLFMNSNNQFTTSNLIVFRSNFNTSSSYQFIYVSAYIQKNHLTLKYRHRFNDLHYIYIYVDKQLSHITNIKFRQCLIENEETHEKIKSDMMCENIWYTTKEKIKGYA